MARKKKDMADVLYEICKEANPLNESELDELSKEADRVFKKCYEMELKRRLDKPDGMIGGTGKEKG